MFGYKPLLLQQCMRAESYSFSEALSHAVNDLQQAQLRAFSNLLWPEGYRSHSRSQRQQFGLWPVGTPFVGWWQVFLRGKDEIEMGGTMGWDAKEESRLSLTPFATL